MQPVDDGDKDDREDGTWAASVPAQSPTLDRYRVSRRVVFAMLLGWLLAVIVVVLIFGR